MRQLIRRHFSSISTEKLTQILKKVSHGWFGEDKAIEIKQAAQESIGIRLGIDAFSLSAQILLAQITHLEDQVEKLDIYHSSMSLQLKI